MGTHIMVIDDEPLICRLLEYQLGGAGYEVASYQRAYDAMLDLARRQPDLILLDVMMPEISGWDLCRQIRASSSIPIIMLTAKDGDDDVVRGLTGGADDYLGKPFSQSQLVARIEAVLRRTQTSPGRARPTPAPAPAPPPSPPVVVEMVPASAVVAPARPRVTAQSPARPPRLGSHLASARRQRGLSLHDAGHACGVRWEFLQAIEQEEFDYVPHTELRRALRAYSGLLNIDLSPYARRRPNRRQHPLALVSIIVMLLALFLILAAQLL